MMGDVSPETCWAIKKQWNNKFCYTVASCWFFLWDVFVCVWCMPRLLPCVISVCVLYSSCYEPFGCWVSKFINNYYYYYYYHHHHNHHLVEGGKNYDAFEITYRIRPSDTTSKPQDHITWHSKLRSQYVGGNIDRNKHLPKEWLNQSINHHCQRESEIQCKCQLNSRAAKLGLFQYLTNCYAGHTHFAAKSPCWGGQLIHCGAVTRPLSAHNSIIP